MVRCKTDPHHYPFWRDAYRRGGSLPEVGKNYVVRGYIDFVVSHKMPSGATKHHYYVVLCDISNETMVYSDQRRREIAFPEQWFTAHWFNPARTYPQIVLLRDALERKSIPKRLRVDTPQWDRRTTTKPERRDA
jgi:hypothetical protein